MGGEYLYKPIDCTLQRLHLMHWQYNHLHWEKKGQYYKPDKILRQVREVELGVGIPCRYIYAFVLNDNIYQEDTFEVEKRLEN